MHSVEPGLKPIVAQLRGLMDQASNLPRPEVRSVGQAKAFGLQADGELVAKLGSLFGTLRRSAPAPDPQGEAAQKKAIGEIVKAAKDKPNPPLELACPGSGGRDERLDPAAIRLLDGLLAEGAFGMEILELRIVRDLAHRAASPGVQAWPEETVKLAWITNVLGELACNRPAALPWVRNLLDQAETSLHEARTLLQSEARDYVTWAQIGEAWQKARQDIDFVATCQDRIEDAQTTMRPCREPSCPPTCRSSMPPACRDSTPPGWPRPTRPWPWTGR